MYLNTTYKAFVAQAAAKLMTEMVGQARQAGLINLNNSFNENESMYEHLAVQDTSAAYKLADHLNDWWEGKDGHQTVFFDVQDSPTSRIECELSDIGDKLLCLTDEIKSFHEECH